MVAGLPDHARGVPHRVEVGGTIIVKLGRYTQLCQPVTIKVVRKGWTDAREITLTRAQIRVPTVYAELLPGDVGYVMVDNFARNTADEFRVTLRDLQKRGAKSIVLDLRWNGGGYLHVAQQMADFLLPKGKLVVETGGRAGVFRDEVYNSRGSSTEWTRTVPLRVLVNGASARASDPRYISPSP